MLRKKTYRCWRPNLSMWTYTTSRALKWEIMYMPFILNIHLHIFNSNTITYITYVSDDAYQDIYRYIQNFWWVNHITNSLSLESLLAFDSCCSGVSSGSKLSRDTWWTSDAWNTLWKHGSYQHHHHHYHQVQYQSFSVNLTVAISGANNNLIS